MNKTVSLRPSFLFLIRIFRMSKKDKKDKLKIDKEKLIKVLFSDGIEKMLDILEKKVKTAYKKGYKKGQKHTSYEDGYKDGEAKGFSDGYSDSNTRYT